MSVPVASLCEVIFSMRIFQCQRHAVSETSFQCQRNHFLSNLQDVKGQLKLLTFDLIGAKGSFYRAKW